MYTFTIQLTDQELKELDYLVSLHDGKLTRDDLVSVFLKQSIYDEYKLMGGELNG